MQGVEMMPMGDMRMVRSLFVIARLMVFGCFLVMARGVFVVFGGLLVMFCGFRRHGCPP
jgi:hypothetical protein